LCFIENGEPWESVALMWPEAVERIAAFVRTSGVQGTIEELLADAEGPPGPRLRVVGFDCDGRNVVALIPANRALDRDRLAAAARCRNLRPAPFPTFPFRPARVFLDRSAVAARTVWLEAGSPRHFLGLAPSELASLLRAETSHLLLDD
jgi:prolyl-tRNA editing enzyme YbaK/EbsC (Cys-tRNA(Pro) deacylase)